MPTQTKENYLKALFYLHQKNKDISLTELSREMEVSTPTVNAMVKKLSANGWVIYKKYKPLNLTAKGKKAASIIIRKHRLAEMFLAQIMGFGWEEVHDMAEEMEHLKSDRLFDRMDELLGFPTVDPHGSPIPDKNGKLVKPNYKRLSEISENQTVRLCALRNSSTDFLIFLNKKKIKLGTIIQVQQIEPFDQSYIVAYGDQVGVVLSAAVSECLLVAEVKN